VRRIARPIVLAAALFTTNARADDKVLRVSLNTLRLPVFWGVERQ
jgi:hypothetical protein